MKITKISFLVFGYMICGYAIGLKEFKGAKKGAEAPGKFYF
jgi:hypothetical protein